MKRIIEGRAARRDAGTIVELLRRPPPPRQIVYAAGGCLLISLLAPFVILPGCRRLWERVCGIFPGLGSRVGPLCGP